MFEYPPEIVVYRAIDNAHAALANPPDDAVFAGALGERTASRVGQPGYPPGGNPGSNS